MSDYNKLDSQALDRHITGNYGEDQYKQMKEFDLQLLAEEIYKAWVEEHKKHYPEVHSGSHPVKPPTWEEMNDKIRLCWLAAAKCAMDEYIS